MSEVPLYIILVPGSGFRPPATSSGLGPRVSGLGCRVSGFGFHFSFFLVSGFGHRASDFGFRGSGFRFLVSGIEVRGSDFGFRGQKPRRAALAHRGSRKDANLYQNRLDGPMTGHVLVQILVHLNDYGTNLDT